MVSLLFDRVTVCVEDPRAKWEAYASRRTVFHKNNRAFETSLVHTKRVHLAVNLLRIRPFIPTAYYSSDSAVSYCSPPGILSPPAPFPFLLVLLPLCLESARSQVHITLLFIHDKQSDRMPASLRPPEHFVFLFLHWSQAILFCLRVLDVSSGKSGGAS